MTRVFGGGAAAGLARLIARLWVRAYGVNQGTFNLYKLVRGDAAGSADAEAKAGN